MLLNPETESNEPLGKTEQLRQLLRLAKRAGFRVRREWFGGEAGGSCEIHGVRWIFVDQSLSLEEQIGQVEDALSQ